MSFGGLIQTISGRNELAKAELGELFQFTEVLLGDGEFQGSFSNKTNLEHEVMRLSISSIKRKESEVILECDFNSKSAERAFYFREIGIVGNGKLCYYDNAGADAEYVDPESSAIVKQKRLRFVLAISSEVELNVELAEGLYALDKDLKQVEAKIPEAVRVKGAAEQKFRTGDIILTAANVGAAEQGLVGANQTLGVTNIGYSWIDEVGNKCSMMGAKSLTKALQDATDEIATGVESVRNMIPAAVRVKGNAESAYRTGDVNLTAENIGAVNKNGDTIPGRLNFSGYGEIRFITPDVTGGHARGMHFLDKNGTDTWGGIGVYGSAGILQGIYIGAGTAYPWDSSYGLRISDTYIKWKNSNLVTENSGTAMAATKATKDGNGNVIASTYLPLAGGIMTGNLTIKNGSSNYGSKINLGDGDYVHISEPTDDCMEIKARKLNFVISDTTDSALTINGTKLMRSTDAVATATKATQDSNGNNIVNTYAKKEWTYIGRANEKGGSVTINITNPSEIFVAIVTYSGSGSSMTKKYIHTHTIPVSSIKNVTKVDLDVGEGETIIIKNYEAPVVENNTYSRDAEVYAR